MRPLVSVIIPTYNRPRLLIDRALPSVFRQTVADQEVLVVGDGTDAFTAEAMTWLAKDDPRVRFWNLPRPDYPADHTTAWGLYGLSALNFGLDNARGEWIAVLGDDDEFTPDHHEILLDAADKTGAEHVYGISETWKGGRMTGQRYGAWPPGDGQFCNGANLYLARLGHRYDLDCWSRGRTGDADLWLRMVDDGVRFAMTDKVVHHYHRNWP